jgi:hypothetical protein
VLRELIAWRSEASFSSVRDYREEEDHKGAIMRWHVTVMLLFTVIPASAWIAGASEENLPARGDKQVIFSFSGWHLTNYKGGIGARYYLGQKTALRFGLDFNWTRDDDTGWTHEDYEDEDRDPRLSTDNYKSSTYSVGIGTILERHFPTSMDVVPLAGLGAFYWRDRSKYEDTYVNHRDETRENVREYKGYTIEGILLAGLQWHFAPNMSLGGEYRVKLAYSYEDYERTVTEEDRVYQDYDSRTDYDLTVDSSMLWLAISF